MIRLRADSAHLRRSIRQHEIEAVFRHAADDAFEEALELGAGDGAQSRLLARYARRLLCTDLNEGRLIREPHPKITYDVCDAEELAYEPGRFDLIYSSNLLEHLREPARAFSAMYRVLRDDGVMVHIVPNRFWKLLHLALFYPSQVISLMEIALGGRNGRGAMAGGLLRNNLKSDRPSFIGRNLWPAVHGEFPNHWAELLRMGAAHWEQLFSEGGFDLVGHVSGLPAHSPYRFGMEIPRRLLEGLGLSSCTGFVLVKRGRSPARARWFTSERP